MERVTDNKATFKQRLEHAIVHHQIGGGFSTFIGHRLVCYVYGTEVDKMSNEEISAVLQRNHIV